VRALCPRTPRATRRCSTDLDLAIPNTGESSWPPPAPIGSTQHLAGVGVDRVHVLDGGLTAYTAAVGARDATVVRGRPRWALERQVRLVAGTLVLAGLGLGLRYPAGRLLTAGIGAGLTVSALTDTCTLGRLLAALPYNRGTRDRTPDQVLAQLPPTPHPA
jgi:hypothetical protein